MSHMSHIVVPKETCLQLARYYHDGGYHKMMWDWLMLWGFYEAWLEIWADNE
jgi:hypothetical protein